MATENTIFTEVHNDKEVQLTYLDLEIHKICKTSLSLEDFKSGVELNKKHIHVILYDEGTPLQILINHPDFLTYEKFMVLIENGADIEDWSCYCCSLLECISEQDFHENYIPILDFLLTNTKGIDYLESPVLLFELGFDEPTEIFPILELLKHEKYLPIFKKHCDKFKTKQVKEKLTTPDQPVKTL